MDELDGKAADM